MNGLVRRARSAGWFWLLAALAYLPAFRSARGLMPSDTKLYLYTDPGRLIADAPWMWDPQQFGGWVPHQMVGYLWPAGPWFWVFDRLGVPDWIAHRLWIGTIFLLASTGVRWSARQLGLSAPASLVAAMCYGLSPYVLPYVGRTSGLLLPWAGLGWMLGLIVRATRTERERWREPALIALVVACLGGLNATATVLVSPPLLLWLVDTAARREITWARALRTAARTAVLCVGVSLWWLAGLAVQGKYGANVLAYSETLDAVTFTSIASEITRGLGYWLFYVVERAGPLTAAAQPYQRVWVVVLLSLLVPLVSLGGLVASRWRARRFAIWCVLGGVLVAVGVHPIHDSAPFIRVVADHPASTISLAFRSSTRALPVVLIGLALGLGAAVTRVTQVLQGALERIGRPSRIATRVVPALAGAALILNLPALWRGQLVNPAQSRAQDPPQAWIDAAAALDADSGSDGRVLQLPGSEFGVHRWGFLVDPLLPGITDKPVVTRDFAPVGSAPAIDLLYALDDRVQDGTLEPASLAPVARLLGVDEVLLNGDLAAERYRNRHPALVRDLLDAAPGLGDPVSYGDPAPNSAGWVTDTATLATRPGDRAIPTVEISPIAEPVPVDRAKASSTLVVGSGMGLVDAAAAGLIDGTELIRYAASSPAGAGSGAESSDAVPPPASAIVTDTNRKQAHQWRGSRDVLGLTEDDGPGVLGTDLADARLPVFPDATIDQFTRAEQRGPVTAIASAYGEPISYRPEDRAARAIDGDTATAWLVADRAEPVGERIRLSVSDGSAVSNVRLLQSQEPQATRWITEIDLVTATGRQHAVLDDTSHRGPGQTIALTDATADWVEIRITATTTGRRDAYPGESPVGFAEIALDDRGPTSEVVVLPSDAASATAVPAHAVVLTRWRAEATDPVRHDPEATIEREWTGAGADYTLSATARLADRIDDAGLAQLFGFAERPYSSGFLPGAPRAAAWAAFDGEPDTAWVSRVGDDSPTLGITFEQPRAIDQATVLFDTAGDRSVPSRVTVTDDQGSRTIDLEVGEDGRATIPGSAGPTASWSMSFETDHPNRSTDMRTMEPIDLPIGVLDVAIPGVEPLHPVAPPAACRADLIRLGSPGDLVSVGVRIEATVDELLDGAPLHATTCDGRPVATTGSVHRLSAVGPEAGGIQIDQVVLRSSAFSDPTGDESAGGSEVVPGPGRIPVTVVDRNRVSRTLDVGPCPEGCWLVHGEGWNPGWQASIGGSSLGAPQVVDGGFNGWWLEPSDSPRTVQVDWAPQRRMWVPLGLSALSAAVVLMLALRRADVVAPCAGPGPMRRGRRAPIGVTDVVILGVVASLAIQPLWGACATAVGVAAALARQRWVLSVAGLGLFASIAAVYTWRIFDLRPFAGYGWVINIDDLHRPTLLALVLIAVALLRDVPAELSGSEPNGG